MNKVWKEGNDGEKVERGTKERPKVTMDLIRDLNEMLKKYELRVKLEFIEDFASEADALSVPQTGHDGQYAWVVDALPRGEE